MKNKSVLTFYQVADCMAIDAKKATANEVLEQIMSLDSSKRVCKNVYQFAMSPDQLVTQLENPSGCSKALLDDIAKELECGATHMFVQPVIGRPVYASLVREFLDEANTTLNLANVCAFAPTASKPIMSKYFDIDYWGWNSGVTPPSWAFNYLSNNGYLDIFQMLVKKRRHVFIPRYRERTQDMNLDCLMFNKRGQLAFKWNSEQDKMAFILKWSGKFCMFNAI